MTRPRLECFADALVCGRNNFGLLRLVLALAVVVSHAFSVTTGLVEDEPLFQSTGFTLGEHAVNAFFAISGFLVTMSFVRRGWRDYSLARVLRIVPGLVAATLVVAFLIGGAMTRLDLASYLTDPRLWRFIQGTLTTFKSAAALPGVFETNPLQFPMGTVWTLKYETFCYLGVLVAGVAGLLQMRRLALGIGCVLVVAVVLREIAAPHDVKWGETVLRLPLIFLSGSLIYLWRDRVPLSLPGLALLLVVLAVLSHTPLYKAALYVGTAWGILVLAMAPSLTRWHTEPSADLSYGAYLYGWPVQQMLHALFPSLGVFILLWPSLAVTLVLAALSWFLVEKPALRLKRRWLLGP
ncbi:acyltransferase family protein [Bosea lathyri]|uniref:Peptidoglycan/LPS O-acetylase OafA/YrhL, contains acyltransferase and SGNH-hydrolase domains n=1 Tax=Bosea lathyri TaxID=1036778 RepID=A0A1H6CWW3_9HYPH|nr:acyltransferase [Bosea lathyri]SEG77550.1 Peptidoglycan/LPS O-acetylase OafA/YrhL, contains acyltransferase and SGNH-hydrolase domains [Bosea lathyri]